MIERSKWISRSSHEKLLLFFQGKVPKAEGLEGWGEVNSVGGTAFGSGGNGGNSVSGNYSTILGGQCNTVTHNYSSVSGYKIIGIGV